MKIFVVLLTVLGTVLAASLPGYFDQSPNGLTRKNDIHIGIVGGTNTTIDEFPSIVGIKTNLAFPLLCGGSIISETRVVTAAHCTSLVTDLLPGAMTVYAGSTKFAGTDGQVRQVAKALRHPDYNSKTHAYDIALLYLKVKLIFGTGVQPIVLASDLFVPAGTQANVTGWGYTSEGGKTSSTLQTVVVPIVDDATCKKAYEAYTHFDEKLMLCAGVPEGGKDSCHGDSGGPLSAHNQVIGIVSWGEGCAREGYPGVYTRVAYFIPWINNNVDPPGGLLP